MIEKLEYLSFGHEVVYVTNDLQEEFVDDMSMHFYKKHAEKVCSTTNYITVFEGLLYDMLEKFRQWCMRNYYGDFCMCDDFYPFYTWSEHGKEFLADY